ncbi:MAG: filamentous hemagglutinin N-terminal domain-containing protein, partial [Pseudomonadota bacterium]
MHFCAFAAPVFANPLDGKVSAGQATISEAGKKLDVHQQSNRAVIDWRGFDVAPDEHTQFHQPDASSVTLNRVHTDRASRINGRVTANGNVVIVNQNGVVFGKNAQVDVNGLIATTADISNKNFMRGRMKFDRPGNPNASVVNEGTITAKQAGLVGLVAPNVTNSGVINARMGRVHLGSGDTTTVDLYGDGLMEIAVSKKVKSQLVVNTGKINADGGRVAITAAAGRQIVNSLVSVGGEIRATSVGSHKGEITIAAEGANALKNNAAKNKGQKTGSSNLLISGVLDVSGRNAGETGGKITATADHVTLTNAAHIDASGYGDMTGSVAGGDIKIGGDYLGKGITPTAKTLNVEAGATILNDALNKGDAGRTIFWSDVDTVFKGSVYARGGALGGNGGFVETSGKQNLLSGGFADLTAAAGNTGLWLLDPTNISIFNRSGSGDLTNTFTTAQLEAMSVSANVALSATNNITLDFTGDTLNFTTSGRSLSLTAGNTITTSSTGAITTTNGGVTLAATSGINLNHAYAFNTGGGAIGISNNMTLGAAQTFNSGNGAITTSGTINGAQNLTINAGTGTYTSSGIIGGTTALNNLSVTADGVALGANVGGTGALLFTPFSAGTTVGLAGGTGTFNLDATEVGRLVNGWSSIGIGRTNGTGAMNVGTATWNDPLTLMTGSGLVTVSGTMTMGANALNVQTDSDLALTGALTGTGALTILPSTTSTTIGLGGGAGTLGLTTAEIAKITNGWASITIGSAAGTGALTANAATWNDVLSLITGSGQLTIAGTQTMGANALTLQTDSDLALTGALTGTGALTIKPSAAATTIGLGGGAGTLGLTTAEIANITNGWTSIAVGSTAGSGAMTVNAATWNDVLTLLSGSGAITIAGTQTMAANNLTIQTDADPVISGALTGTGTLTVIPTTASTTIGLGGGAGALGFSTAEIANITNGWGSLVFGATTGTGAMTVNATTWNDNLTLRSNTGAITVAGTQTMGANNLTIQTDADLALNGALTSTGTLIIRPTTASTTMGLGGGAGTLNLSAAEIANITNGWTSLVFGSGTTTGAMAINALTWNDVLTLQTGSGAINISGAQTMGANALNIFTDSDLALTGSLTGTGVLTISPITAATTVGLGGGAGTLNLSATELAFITDGWTSLNFGSSSITGAMTVNAMTWNDPLNLTTAAGVMTIAGTQTMGANALILQTDSNLALNGALTGTGALTIRPTTAATTMGIAGGAGTLNLTSAELLNITDGWASIAFGGTSITGAMTVNAATWNEPVSFITASGLMTIAGTQTMGANALILQTDSNLTLNGALTGTGALTIRPTTAATTIGIGGGAGTLNLTSAELLNVTDGWSSITFGTTSGTGAMTLNAATWNEPINLLSSTGVITIAGAQSMGANALGIQTSGDLTLNAALTGTSTLTIQPTTATTTIGLGGGAGTLGLT